MWRKLFFQSHHELNLFVMIVMVIEGLCAFGLVFLACELGEQFSAQYDDISNVIHHLKWYTFPIKVQQMLPTIILIAQQPVAIECFGSYLCLRTTLKSVCILPRYTVAIVCMPNNLKKFAYLIFRWQKLLTHISPFFANMISNVFSVLYFECYNWTFKILQHPIIPFFEMPF